MKSTKPTANKPLFLALSAFFSLVALALVAGSFASFKGGLVSPKTPAVYTVEQENTCSAGGGTWKPDFPNGCADKCGAGPICTQSLTPGCDCGADKCWDETRNICVSSTSCSVETEDCPIPNDCCEGLVCNIPPLGQVGKCTVTTGNRFVILKVKLAGVTSKPANAGSQIIKIYGTSSDGGLMIGLKESPQSVIFTPDDAGVYSGKMLMTEPVCYEDSPECLDYFGKHYRLRVKGPKHKQVVFDNILFPKEGGMLDLTVKPLPAGDINQDGRVDINDLSAIKIFTNDLTGDLNYDNIVDVFDKQLVLNTLAVSFDEE